MKKISLISATCVFIVGFSAARSTLAVEKNDSPPSHRNAVYCEGPLSTAFPPKKFSISNVAKSVRQSFSDLSNHLPWASKTVKFSDIPPPPISTRAPFTYHRRNLIPELDRYLEEEFAPSSQRRSDKPGVVYNFQNVVVSATDSPIPKVSSEAFPRTMKELKDHNRIAILINHSLLIGETIPKLLNENVKAEEAFQRMHETLMDGVYLQDIPEEAALNKPLQIAGQKHRLRQDKGLVVGFANSVAPHGKDMDKIMELFHGKVDKLMSQSINLADAVTVAVWARHTILELQPAIDGNTRAARAYMTWIIGSVAKRFGISVDIEKIDLDAENFQKITVNAVDKIGNKATYNLGSGVGIKDLLSLNFITDMLQFSHETGGPFYILIKNNELHTEGATNIVANDLYDSDYLDPSRPEWRTVRDFEVLKIEHTAIESLRVDPLVKNEATILFKEIIRILGL